MPDRSDQKEISQKNALYVGFGEVLRSSAIFYVRQAPRFQTTISFMDYWREKRGLNVAIIASLRALDGRLLKRERLRFSRGPVVNYVPNPSEGDSFEGSVEIEVFGSDNLVFPYPAIMAVYRSRRGISMVHSYARAYSRHEVEERRTLSNGAEANWTLRDAGTARSFAIFHNGAGAQKEQTATLEITAANGQRTTMAVPLPAIPPYGTVRIRPADYVSDLPALLGGQPGHGSLRFDVNESFTRMLVGNEADGDDFQATHSDFDFRINRTDHLAPDGPGYLYVPSLAKLNRWIVVYPSQDHGRYRLSAGDFQREFADDDFLFHRIDGGERMAAFVKINGMMPTRLNVGIGCQASPELLPSEPSLGVVHHMVPPKRMAWGLIGAHDSCRARIVIHPCPEVFGEFPKNGRISLRLYSAGRAEYLATEVGLSALADLDSGVLVEDLFAEARDHLAGEFGYFTAYSEYGGLRAYSLLERPDSRSVTFEHAF